MKTLALYENIKKFKLNITSADLQSFNTCEKLADYIYNKVIDKENIDDILNRVIIKQIKIEPNQDKMSSIYIIYYLLEEILDAKECYERLKIGL